MASLQLENQMKVETKEPLKELGLFVYRSVEQNKHHNMQYNRNNFAICNLDDH